MIKLITGRNGIGKTYCYFWNNQNLNVSFCSQNIYDCDMSISEYINYTKNIDEAKIYKLLNKIGINNYNTKLSNLSGGQRQYIHVLSCLYSNSNIYIFDEPTNNLDNENTEMIWNLLIDNLDKNIKIITHDPRIFELAGVDMSKIDFSEIEEHDIETSVTDENESQLPKPSESIINKDFIKNKINRDRETYLYPISLVSIILLAILVTTSVSQKLIYDYNSLPDDVAVVSNMNYECDYNMYVTGQETCVSQMSDKSIEEKLSDILNIANLHNAEHLLVTNDQYLEKIYEALEVNKTIEINTYAKLEQVEYTYLSEICTSPNIIDGDIATQENEFTAGSTYMLDTYGEAKIGKEYDGKTYTGINKNNVICSVSKAGEQNWYLDLLDEKQLTMYLDHYNELGEGAYTYEVPDLIYLGDNPDEFTKDITAYGDLTTISRKLDNKYMFRLNVPSYLLNISIVLIVLILFQIWYLKHIKKAAEQQFQNTIHVAYKSMKFEVVLQVVSKKMLTILVLVNILVLCLLLTQDIDISFIVAQLIAVPIEVYFVYKVNKRIKKVI